MHDSVCKNNDSLVALFNICYLSWVHLEDLKVTFLNTLSRALCCHHDYCHGLRLKSKMLTLYSKVFTNQGYPKASPAKQTFW